AALDVATAALALRDSVIPPTVGVRAPALPEDIWLVRDRPHPARLRTVLIVARGFGGVNAALVLGAPRGSQERTTNGDNHG
ncbi:MAG TPA: hypothetical protein VIS06_20210, partial [Mycobacteriales bacterium]